MNIYQRPLFRQAGGPSAPMASDMPAMAAIPPEMQAQIQQTEQNAAQEMEAYGRAYVNEMVTGLDNAEDTEQVINAIRGNKKSIQDRYNELAGLVGDEDAQATPESVLALVQPTIMMTEQGALDTGIGELVQKLTGNISMETEDGAPTEMGQGIGELMMGAQEAEVAPQQYANGGYVVKLQQAGPANVLDRMAGFTPMTQYDTSGLQQSYEARLPLYEQLLGDTEARRKQAQSSLYFDIAKAGLSLASGVDPSTGQSMTNQPLGAQLARATMPVAEAAQKAGSDVTEAERTARIAALQSAETEQQARLAQVGREREALFGGLTQQTLQKEQQGFIAGQSELDRTLKRESQESSQAHEKRLFGMESKLRTSLLQMQGDQRINEILKSGEVQSALQGKIDDAAMDRLVKQGEVSMALEQLGIEGRKALQDIIGTQAMQQLERRGELEKSLFDAETARRASEMQTSYENDLSKLGVIQSHEMDMQADRLDLAREQMDRSLGGTGMLWWKTPSAAELAADAQEFQQAYQKRAQFLGEQWNGVNAQLERDRFNFQRQGYNDELAMRMAEMQNQAMIAALGSIEESQYRFGNSIEGVVNNMISDVRLLDQYASGILDATNPNATAMLNTAIATYLTPRTQYNPETGQFSQVTPLAPRQLLNALNIRQDNGLSTPFAKGGEVKKYQTGGQATSKPDSGWSRVNKYLNRATEGSQMPEEPDLPARIISEDADLAQGVGVIAPFRTAIRTAGSYGRELGLVEGEAPEKDAAEAQVQLTALANVTQRFVRESVAGRALKDEIEALAAELAKPGIGTREAAQERLSTMRNQLLEIQDMAQSIIDNPSQFSQSQVTNARQDLRRVGPLLENYDRAIASFERALMVNKPDPAMFEGRR